MIDLSAVKKIHFVGIKGIAMAALAVYCRQRGFVVGGTDTGEEFPSDEVLKKAGISPLVGFDAAHIAKGLPDLVIYTGAHNGRENTEVAEAIKKHIPVLPHGKALGVFMEGKRQICVAGSHGKTTTSAMTATILSHAGFDPSYAIGCGEIAGLGLSGHYGKGDWFIAEADEYVTDPGHDTTPRFLWQNPEVLVVTNIDYDHPDVYASADEITAAFVRLRNKILANGEIVLPTDEPSCKPLVWTKSPVSLVGFGSDAAYRITNLYVREGKTHFQLETNDIILGEVTLRVAGKHNATNAALAAVAAHRIGVSWAAIQRGLADFGGAKRRFEQIGVVGTTVFYDDYAHHPREIRATLSAAREWYPKRRIIAVFQPHTYSRTKSLLGEFAKAFSDATVVITTDIYSSAREDDTLGISGGTLSQEVATHHHNAFFAKDKTRVSELLSAKMQDGDIVIFMGAGDIGNWGREIVEEMINAK